MKSILRASASGVQSLVELTYPGMPRRDSWPLAGDAALRGRDLRAEPSRAVAGQRKRANYFFFVGRADRRTWLGSMGSGVSDTAVARLARARCTPANIETVIEVPRPERLLACRKRCLATLGGLYRASLPKRCCQTRRLWRFRGAGSMSRTEWRMSTWLGPGGRKRAK